MVAPSDAEKAVTAPLPSSMRACVYQAPGKLAVETRTLPEMGPRDTLLRVSHCGFAGL